MDVHMLRSELFLAKFSRPEISHTIETDARERHYRDSRAGLVPSAISRRQCQAKTSTKQEATRYTITQMTVTA
jgi:hypothetical protein